MLVAPPAVPPVASTVAPPPAVPSVSPPTADSLPAYSQQPTALLEQDLAAAGDVGFSISHREIRLEAYHRFAKANGRVAPLLESGAGRNCPVWVTWWEAVDYPARAGLDAHDFIGQSREWTFYDYREEYEGQERRSAMRLPEAVEIRSSNGRAEADPLNRDLGFWLVREP